MEREKNELEKNERTDILTEFRTVKPPSNLELINKINQAISEDNPKLLGDYFEKVKKIAFDYLTLGYYEEQFPIYLYNITFRTLTQEQLVEYEQKVNPLLSSGNTYLADVYLTAFYIQDISLDYAKEKMLKEQIGKDIKYVVPPIKEGLEIPFDSKVKFLKLLPLPVYNFIVDKLYEFTLLVNTAIRFFDKIIPFFSKTEIIS